MDMVNPAHLGRTAVEMVVGEVLEFKMGQGLLVLAVLVECRGAAEVGEVKVKLVLLEQVEQEEKEKYVYG